MRYTEEQERIFAAGTDSHLKIIAYAGSGKTTTLVELQRRTRRRALYCPFNRTIAEEAQSKFVGTNSKVSTLHAFAWNAVRKPGQDPHSGGAADIRSRGLLRSISIPNVKGWGEYRMAAAANRALSRFCVSDSREITDQHVREALIESVGDPDILLSEPARMKAEEALSRLARPIKSLAESYLMELLTSELYTHDLYLKMLDMSPVLLRMAFSGYQVIYKDEAQDTNPVEHSILQKSGRPIISVGDPFQQIYSWRGAENSLEKMPGKTFFLTESFRFGPDIAALAMQVLNSRPEKRPELPLIGAGNGSGGMQPANAILCRTNSGVIDEALNVAAKGRRYFVDNASSLVSDIRSAQSLQEGVKPKGKGIFAIYDSWDEAVAEAEAGDRALERIIKIVEDGRSEEVIGVINASSQNEKQAEITIMTAHRSKGREFPFVMLGNDWRTVDEMKKRWKKAKQKSERETVLALEEFNALYVAVTRARKKIHRAEELLGK